MHIVKTSLLLVSLCCLPVVGMAKTVAFDLNIDGNDVKLHKSLELSDVGEGKTAINFDFEDTNGKKYSNLADNRSYPTNLDITVKDATGAKLGYLFFAINDVDFLQQMGKFGLIFDVDGQPMDGTNTGAEQLLFRIYFSADSLETLRESMYA